jgi:hypothetical protein
VGERMEADEDIHTKEIKERKKGVRDENMKEIVFPKKLNLCIP